MRATREKTIELSPEEIEALSGLVYERSRASFFFFAKYVLEFDLLTEQTHKRWADDLQYAIMREKMRLMRLKPRGTFKTSVYGIAFILWLWAVHSPQIRIFYTSSNSLLLDEVSDKLNQYVGSEKNDTLYSSIFGITRDSNAKNTSEVFNIHGRSGKGFSLVIRTAGGSTVGIHPNIVIIDDALDKNDRESAAIRKQKERWFDTLTPLLVPFRKDPSSPLFESIFYIGTRWHMDDLCEYIFATNKRLPENMKWDIEVESIIDKSGHSAYPEFISDEKIGAIKANVDSVFFACQYLNSALPDGMQIFDLKRLSFIRPDQFDISVGTNICVFDPSLGKESSDYPAVWFANFHDEMLTFFDAIEKKIELGIIVHVIANQCREYGCRTILYENTGLSLVEQTLKKAFDRLNFRIKFEVVPHTSRSSKEERIVSMQPDLYSGAVRFMSDYETRYPEAMNQIAFFPVYKNDDFPDAAQMAVDYFRRPQFVFKRYEACY